MIQDYLDCQPGMWKDLAPTDDLTLSDEDVTRAKSIGLLFQSAGAERPMVRKRW